ncbi:uncharacterized protein LOC129919545 [Episyrphus balteatus]|uniref:uncharacterized protein LOC129919545 n=1 Tax=Episyrphus balteatus TaxID=286459 RepID=UPI002486BD75|nr:uncharacterized protein LOC129919545 [Episyrphus balteatus]
MSALKIIVLCAIISVAMSSSIPEQKVERKPKPLIQIPLGGFEVLQRKTRSPDDEPKRTVEARGEHHDRHGTSASVTYTHPVGPNMDVYGGVSRNFKYNDNSGHVGVRYKF